MNKPTNDALAGILERAGREILMPAFLQQDKPGRNKSDGSLVTESDLACQRYIRDRLAADWPDIAFLGEEMRPDEQQSCLNSGGSFWCLDPLDGTTNFVTSLPVFALSLALIENGSPKLACIVDPVRSETFCAEIGHGAQLNGTPLQARPVESMKSAVGFVDFKRLNAAHREIMNTPGQYRSQRNIGSCALEWAWLAAGRAQFIVHGGEKIWDFSAGGLIAAEAGCTLSDFAGKPLFVNIRQTSSIAATSSDALHENLLLLLNG